MRAAQIAPPPGDHQLLHVDHKLSALTTIPATTLVDDRPPPSPNARGVSMSGGAAKRSKPRTLRGHRRASTTSRVPPSAALRALRCGVPPASVCGPF
jgi:hypothetical protein